MAFEQLIAVGLSASGISRRVRAGRLHRVYRGVYAVGHTKLSSEGRWMAALLAYGNGAVLSHRSAAELWRLLAVGNGPVHVTVAGTSGRRKRPGICLHRSQLLTRAVTSRRRGIDVTTPARTLADLRQVATIDELRRAIRQAEFQGFDVGAAGRERELTRSRLERRFLWLCRRHRVERPEVNARIGPYEVDFLWRSRLLIVETDGYGSHSGRSAFEDDRERDLTLKLRGYEVVRFTYQQVVDEPLWVMEGLRALLSAR